MKEKEYKQLILLQNEEMLMRPVMLDRLENTVARTGTEYVKITFSDGRSTVSGNLFQLENGQTATVDALNSLGIKDGMLVTITIFKNKDGFVNIKKIETSIDPDVSIKDFAHKAEEDPDKMYDYIMNQLREVSAERKTQHPEELNTIADLVIAFYERNCDLIKWSSAAQKMHSAYAHGLLEHTQAMLKASQALCHAYPDLDKEILVSAVCAHDFGKIEELYTDALGRANYTAKGIGIGHIVLSYTYIEREVQANPNKYPQERVFLLESAILSHHGKKEYGSPIEPITFEGYVLNLLDQMDAVHKELKNGLEGLKPGEITPPGQKVDGIGHSIYRPLDK